MNDNLTFDELLDSVLTEDEAAPLVVNEANVPAEVEPPSEKKPPIFSDETVSALEIPIDFADIVCDDTPPLDDEPTNKDNNEVVTTETATPEPDQTTPHAELPRFFPDWFWPTVGTYWVNPVGVVVRVLSNDKNAAQIVITSVGCRCETEFHINRADFLRAFERTDHNKLLVELAQQPPEETDEPEQPDTEPNEPPSTFAEQCSQIAEELGTKPRQVETLLETTLATILQFLTFKGFADTSPVVEKALAFVAKPAFIESATPFLKSLFWQLTEKALDSIVTERLHEQAKLVLQTIESTTNNFERVFVGLKEHSDEIHAIKEVFSEYERGRVFLEKRIANLEERSVAAVQAVDIKTTDGIDYQSAIEEINADIDALGVRIDKLCRTRSAWEDSIERNRAAGHDARRKTKEERAEKRNAAKRTAFELKARERRLQEDLEDVGIEPDGSIGLRDKKSSKPVKHGPGRPKKYEKRATPQAPKKAGFSVKGASAADDAPNDEDDGKTIGPTLMRKVDRFMGKDRSPKVRALFGRVPARNLLKLLEQARTRLPDMATLTHWTPAEQGTFAQWFYSAKRRR